MNYNKNLALIPALLLAACGGEEQTINEPAGSGAVVYSYPADGQISVSPETDAVLRFSHPVTETREDLQSKIAITANGSPIAFTVEMIDGGRSLKLAFDEALAPATDYTLSFNDPLAAAGNRAVGVPNAQGAPGVQFRTRGSFSGIAAIANQADSFKVASQVPAPDGDFEAMNFSTFRLTMTQPIHPQWETMGGSIQLLDKDGQPVPATVLVKGNRIALDPCVTQDPLRCGGKKDVLTSGDEYTLSIQNLASLTDSSQGNRFTTEWTFIPRGTGPTVVLQQSAIDSGLGLGVTQKEATKSILNGQPINGVTLNSVLQGNAGPSQQTGDLFAELAYAPAFEADEALPLRIAKGSVLRSTSLDVRVGGVVPVLDAETGILQNTGDIKVTMMSDASGYMSPNAYTDDMNAPRHITLFMDVAMNTESAQPNAALSQTLMGVELRGIAIVKDGVLTIDAIGTVEPVLLGQEHTDSTIAFHLQAATGVDSVLDADQLREFDTTSPQLVSWMPGPDSAAPGNRDQMQRPGDPIVLNFDEPLNQKSVADGIRLFEGNTEIDPGNIDSRLDGTTIALHPTGGLRHGIEYSIQISSSLTDLSGNGATAQTLTFALPAIKDGNEAAFASPIALTSYPGFPCVTHNRDLTGGSHGTCMDSAPSRTVRDQLPVTTLPADRPIVVQFSQSMALETINRDSFVVEKVANSVSPAALGSEKLVPGRLEKSNQRIRFYPDQPWEPGSLYRYTMKSAVNGDCSTGIYVCSEENLPLQTDLLVDPSDIGGPNLTIYFTGTESQPSVFTPLRNLPIRDTNSNYVVDCAPPGGTTCLEPFDHEPDTANGGYLPSANSTKLMVVNGESTAGPARVGCSPDNADCPKNKFIYQTYGLDTEVIGPAFDENGNNIGVRVLLYPTLLATSSAKVLVSANLLFGSDITSETGIQILRMTYGEPTPGNPLGLVEGIIAEGSNGGPVFKTVANLTLDAPNLSGVTSHDVYSKPLQLQLEGPITFFDDGRMQIEQRNLVAADIEVNAVTFGFVPVTIPLQIPESGAYLNFVSNPVKELPAVQ